MAPEQPLQFVGEREVARRNRAGRVRSQGHDQVDVAAAGVESSIGRRAEYFQPLDAELAAKLCNRVAMLDKRRCEWGQVPILLV